MADAKAHRPGAGHPIEIPDELLLEICSRHAEGENLLAILEDENGKRREGMPAWSTFWERCCSDTASDELSTAFTRARSSWAAKVIDQVPVIADTTQEGIETSDGPKGRTTKRGDMLGHRELRVKTRTWFAERVLSGQYSPRVKNTLQNPDGSPIDVRPVINLTVLPPPKEGV